MEQGLEEKGLKVNIGKTTVMISTTAIGIEKNSGINYY
jgi:hypothetical protein